jgi:hypothetical protein
MVRFCIFAALVILAIAPHAGAQTMGGTCQCTGCHGSYRWSVKNSSTQPPATSKRDYLIVEMLRGAAWRQIRQRVLSFTTAHFPTSVAGGRLLHMTAHPVVRVVGRAFDAVHAPRGNTSLNTRRAAGGVTASIWEIHPVMKLNLVQ